MQPSKSVKIDEFVGSLQRFISDTYQIEVPADKIKGVAISTLRQAGALDPKDEYKTYEHISVIIKMFKDSLGVELEWEDIEYFTGNLFYAMRVATKRPLEDIERLAESYKNTERFKTKEDMQKQIMTDLFLLKQDVRGNITKTWEYLEKTQQRGVSMIISKLLKLVRK